MCVCVRVCVCVCVCVRERERDLLITKSAHPAPSRIVVDVPDPAKESLYEHYYDCKMRGNIQKCNAWKESLYRATVRCVASLSLSLSLSLCSSSRQRDASVE